MENNDNNPTEGSTLSTIAIVGGLIFFFITIFYIFYGFIARRAQRKITMAVAWFIVFCLEINVFMLLYDRVLNPLQEGLYRWPDKPDVMLRLGIAYVIVYIVALWEMRKEQNAEKALFEEL